jgi:hypothetical protein
MVFKSGILRLSIDPPEGVLFTLEKELLKKVNVEGKDENSKTPLLLNVVKELTTTDSIETSAEFNWNIPTLKKTLVSINKSNGLIFISSTERIPVDSCRKIFLLLFPSESRIVIFFTDNEFDPDEKKRDVCDLNVVALST